MKKATQPGFFDIAERTGKLTEMGDPLVGLKVKIDFLDNPRVEKEEDYYSAKNTKLVDLGLKPHMLGDSLLDSLLNIAIRYRDRVNRNVIMPKVNWRNVKSDRLRPPQRGF